MCPALVHTFNPPDRLVTDSEWRDRVFEAAIGAKLIVSLGADAVYYWRDGDREVDYVVQHDGELIAIEIKSGRNKRSGGLAEFRKNFVDAIIIILDRDVGEKLLGSQNPWDLIKGLL